MTEKVLIIGTVGVLIIVLIVIFRGQKLKNIKFGSLEAELDTGSDRSSAFILITKIPDRVAWLNIVIKLNGKTVSKIKAKDKGGQEIVTEVAIETEGSAQYSIEADGVQRLYDSQGQLTPVDYSAFGSGEVNIVYGKKFIIHEVSQLGRGGATFSLRLESYDNFESGVLPDDIAEAEIMRMINED